MTTKLLFDTLNYARLLENGGVGNADVHASSLVTALSQNIYTKDEVDMRIERAINHFEKTLSHFEKTIDTRFSEIDKRFTESELRMEKMMNRNFITTVSILGALIVVVGAISTFAHAIFY